MVTILLVEDHELNRDMLARRLRRKGFSVLEAANGQAALDTASAQAVDLVLMDMTLPVLDGWQTTKRFRQDPNLAPIPIIGLSAHVGSRDREKSLDAGCNDYHTKPIEFNRLLQDILKLLELARNKQELP